MRLVDRLRGLEVATRPVDPETATALERRWNTLPANSQVPGQLLGRRSTGCEATHGVFPKCDFACKPCYHSVDANKVRVDGAHTLAEVDKQMGFLRKVRGHGQFAQLIGGEVSLLDPGDHAAALTIMRRHGRLPMSFTHGDFDYKHLLGIALDESGEPRFPDLSFACHIDTTMVGRKGIKKPKSEAELDDYRGRFCAMFDRLKDEHGVRSYLAHNMTVTPENVDEIADVVRNCHGQGWRMFSFQPAAFIGHENRWKDDFRELSSDLVWAEIEAGAGSTLPYGALRMGDTRCNRATWGAYLGDRYVPLLDDTDERDRATVEAALTAFPGNFALRDPAESAVRLARSIGAHPSVLAHAVGWAKRFAQRGGGASQKWWRAKPVTFVMHSFIDAADSAAGWAHIQAGTRATEPRILEAQERLEACAYSMGHAETEELVPACVQHGVLDPIANRKLAQLLPLRSKVIIRTNS